MANPVVTFPGGSVVDTSTVEDLRESASEWHALAAIHQADAELAADRGDFETAIKQNRFAELKLATARVRYADALKLQQEAGK